MPELTASEMARIMCLIEMLPKGRQSILDVGSRDGRVTRSLSNYFRAVTALDLEKPNIDVQGVVNVKGNVTQLEFTDNYFDTVLCSEVLEHIPPRLLQKACSELARVARYDVVIGVPYKQDIRCGRTTCITCCKINPPWGHVNSFDEKKLVSLLKSLTPVSKYFIGSHKDRTNILSVFLMDIAGNPWGVYSQEEPCIHCGAKLVGPATRSSFQKGCSVVSHAVNRVQRVFISAIPSWIHMVFQKREFVPHEGKNQAGANQAVMI